MSSAVAALILLPFGAAVAAFFGGRRLAPVLLGATATAVLASLALLARGLWTGGEVRIPIGGWGGPLGIELALDGLSLLMLAGALPVTAAVGLQALRRRAEPLFWPLFFAFWGTLDALFLSADMFNIYVVLELLTLCSVTLIAWSGSSDAVAAAFRYMLAAMLGSVSVLFGIGLLYGVVGSLSLHDITGLATLGAGGRWAAALILIGLFLKAAAFPLHFWLPPAYLHAAPPGDALLAALGSKAAVYLMIRLWPSFTGEAGIGMSLPFALGALGSAAVLWASLLALRAARIKELLAFSSISQMGYIPLLFPLSLAAAASQPALAGVAMLLLSHTLAAAAMFLAAEGISTRAGSDLISGLSRGGGCPPLAVYAFGLGGVSLIGLPPSGGFVAKWLLLKASYESGQWWWIPPFALGSLLTAGYVFRVLRETVSQDHFGQPAVAADATTSHFFGFLLAASAILLGLFATWPLELLWRGGMP